MNACLYFFIKPIIYYIIYKFPFFIIELVRQLSWLVLGFYPSKVAGSCPATAIAEYICFIISIM